MRRHSPRRCTKAAATAVLVVMFAAAMPAGASTGSWSGTGSIQLGATSGGCQPGQVGTNPAGAGLPLGAWGPGRSLVAAPASSPTVSYLMRLSGTGVEHRDAPGPLTGLAGPTASLNLCGTVTGDCGNFTGTVTYGEIKQGARKIGTVGPVRQWRTVGDGLMAAYTTVVMLADYLDASGKPGTLQLTVVAYQGCWAPQGWQTGTVDFQAVVLPIS